ncbi:PTS sugar transporter subunit IIB [Traorella massiliensis]|uniref:PTS sugar transporter subunit IIB n=1 Tax=Traorella massiliensis TaxID=1903263 RepID=UPI0008F8679E|nr:PTS sugar transporter subunit IIB [Traorella massiliensis]
MLNVVLLCQFGASTGMLAENIRKAADTRNIEMVINAYSIADAKNVVGNADVILLGPQLRYQKDVIVKLLDDKKTPIIVIEPLDYGMMNGENVLNLILNEVKA